MSELTWQGKAEALAIEDGPTAVLPPLDPAEDHLLVGDNLEVGRALLATHAGAAHVVYLDPPYNAGTRASYRDHYRTHDAWLSAVAPRMVLARRLLRPDGVLLVSIDDHEVARLRLLLDEVFGERAFLGTFTWETKRVARGVPPRSMLVWAHEYVLAYGQGFRFRGDARTPEGYANPDGDSRGPWRSESMKATGTRQAWFDIVDPATGRSYRGNWAFSPATLREMIKDGRVLFPRDGEGVPRQKKHLGTYRNATKAIVTALGWHSTERGTSELQALFDGERPFHNPKPLSLLVRLLDQALPPAGLVVDLYAGSGTTGHAAMALNAQDQGQRRYLLVQDEADEGVAVHCAERLVRAAAALGSSPPRVLKAGRGVALAGDPPP